MSVSVPASPSPRLVWAGVQLERITVCWMTLEAAVALGAGLVAHSLLLTAFGLDSVIELVSGGILLWRLTLQAEGASLTRVEAAERRAAWVVAGALGLLSLYVVVSSAFGLLGHARPERSVVGIALALVAVVGMPLLAWRKRMLARQLNSAALRGDAACSLTCAYMAATLLLGLLLTALLGWWWADSLGALVFLAFLLPEAREAILAAGAGKAACACGEDGCTE